MASNKIKFEMTLKELNFKFEGDYEQGQRIQSGITRALGDIANIQNNAMGAKPPALIDLPPANTPSTRRKRRRKTQDGAEEGDPASPQGDGELGLSEEPTQRRSNSESPTLLLMNLRKTGFFETPKSASQILDHLTTKGHTSIAHSDLTSPLTKLCQRDVLVRNKPDGKSWHYGNGAKDE
jgi:hypothetical protein